MHIRTTNYIYIIIDRVDIDLTRELALLAFIQHIVHAYLVDFGSELKWNEAADSACFHSQTDEQHRVQI